MRRCRRSLTKEMTQVADSPQEDENRARTRSRTPLKKTTVQAATPRKGKRGRSASSREGTPAKKPAIRDVYEMKSSTEESDSSQSSVPVKSFYGGTKHRYLSPLERSRLKQVVDKAKAGRNEGQDLNASLDERKWFSGSMKTPKSKGSVSVKTRKAASVPRKASSLPCVVKYGAPKPVRSTAQQQVNENSPAKTSHSASKKKIFRNKSPGKKVSVLQKIEISKGGFKISFKPKKVRLGSSPRKQDRAAVFDSEMQSSRLSRDSTQLKPMQDKTNLHASIGKPDEEKGNGRSKAKHERQGGSIENWDAIITKPTKKDNDKNTFSSEFDSMEQGSQTSGDVDSVFETRSERDIEDVESVDASVQAARNSASSQSNSQLSSDAPGQRSQTPSDSGRVSALSNTESVSALSNTESVSALSNTESVSALSNTESGKWSTISNQSCSLELLPENKSPSGGFTILQYNESSPDVSDGSVSPLETPEVTPRSGKLYSLLSSRAASPSLRAEDFLPTPERKDVGDAIKSKRHDSAEKLPESSPKLFPIFSSSSRAGSTSNASSCPGTPQTNTSSLRQSPRKHLTATPRPATPKLTSQVSSTSFGTPRQSPRRSPRKAAAPLSAPRSSKTSPGLWRRLKTKGDKDDLSQMTLDFGQKLQAVEACPQCGMTYTRGEPSDEAMHAKFHSRLNSSLRYKSWQHERVVQELGDGSRVVMVLHDDKAPMKKVEAVKKIVDQDLGFVVEPRKYNPQSKAFLYVTSEQRIIGFCLAEVITKGYKVITEEEVQNEGSPTKRRRPWCCSTDPQRARCGINRIWVLASERHHGVASQLLDCVRFNFVMGYVVPKTELAFSDPTPDGRHFATKYTADPHFLVYKH